MLSSGDIGKEKAKIKAGPMPPLSTVELRKKTRICNDQIQRPSVFVGSLNNFFFVGVARATSTVGEVCPDNHIPFIQKFHRLIADFLFCLYECKSCIVPISWSTFFYRSTILLEPWPWDIVAPGHACRGSALVSILHQPFKLSKPPESHISFLWICLYLDFVNP